MSLKNMSKEELEILSYADLANLILKENKKPMNTANIFKYICELLEYSEDDYVSKIADFYTSLTIDKRFILLENNEWDLRENHAVEIVLDNEDEEFDEELDKLDEEEEEVDIEEEYEEDVDIPLDDEDLDDEDDDIDDLAILSEDEIDEI